MDREIFPPCLPAAELQDSWALPRANGNALFATWTTKACEDGTSTYEIAFFSPEHKSSSVSIHGTGVCEELPQHLTSSTIVATAPSPFPQVMPFRVQLREYHTSLWLRHFDSARRRTGKVERIVRFAGRLYVFTSKLATMTHSLAAYWR